MFALLLSIQLVLCTAEEIDFTDKKPWFYKYQGPRFFDTGTGKFLTDVPSPLDRGFCSQWDLPSFPSDATVTHTTDFKICGPNGFDGTSAFLHGFNSYSLGKNGQANMFHQIILANCSDAVGHDELGGKIVPAVYKKIHPTVSGLEDLIFNFRDANPLELLNTRKFRLHRNMYMGFVRPAIAMNLSFSDLPQGPVVISHARRNVICLAREKDAPLVFHPQFVADVKDLPTEQNPQEYATLALKYGLGIPRKICYGGESSLIVDQTKIDNATLSPLDLVSSLYSVQLANARTIMAAVTDADVDGNLFINGNNYDLLFSGSLDISKWWENLESDPSGAFIYDVLPLSDLVSKLDTEKGTNMQLVEEALIIRQQVNLAIKLIGLFPPTNESFEASVRLAQHLQNSCPDKDFLLWLDDFAGYKRGVWSAIPVYPPFSTEDHY